MDPAEITPEPDPRQGLEEAMYELKRVIVGQDAMLERLLVALLAGGHVLLEGVPGLAKTLTVKTLAQVLGGQLAADVVAVHLGQVAVEHHHVVGMHARLEQRGRAVGRDVDGHALAAQPAGDGRSDPRFVLGHQYAHASEGRRDP